MARPNGLEPLTVGLVARHSIQLSYERVCRVVGYALHVNPDPEGIPCYRVVTKDGRVSDAFAFGGGNEQIALLKADGIEFIDETHVDMERFQWRT